MNQSMLSLPENQPAGAFTSAASPVQMIAAGNGEQCFRSASRSAPDRLVLPERPPDLIAHRLRQIGKDASLPRLQEGLHRHAGQRREPSQPIPFLLHHLCPDDIIALAGTLVRREIRRYRIDMRVQLGRDPLIEGRKAQGYRLPHGNLIDILRWKFQLRHERVLVRNDLQDRFCRRDDGSFGMDAQLVNDPGLRCLDIDPFQIVLGGDQALGKLAAVAFGLAQLIGNLRTVIGIDLQDLQLGFGDLAPGLGDR